MLGPGGAYGRRVAVVAGKGQQRQRRQGGRRPSRSPGRSHHPRGRRRPPRSHRRRRSRRRRRLRDGVPRQLRRPRRGHGSGSGSRPADRRRCRHGRRRQRCGAGEPHGHLRCPEAGHALQRRPRLLWHGRDTANRTARRHRRGAMHLVEDSDIVSVASRPAAYRATSGTTPSWWLAGFRRDVRGSGYVASAPAAAARAWCASGFPVPIRPPCRPAPRWPGSLGGAGFDTEVLERSSRFHALVVGPGLGSRRSRAPSAGSWPLPGFPPSSMPTASRPSGEPTRRAALVPCPLGRPHRPSRPTMVSSPRLSACRRPGPDRVGAAAPSAARTGAVVLLKGATTGCGGARWPSLAGGGQASSRLRHGPARATSSPAWSGPFCARGGRTPCRLPPSAAHVHGRAAAAGSP